MSRTISASIGLLFLFFFVILFGLTGCEKIVTVTEIRTDTLIKIDTVTDTVPKGPGYIRFISMLPNRSDANVLLYRGPSTSSAPFSVAGDQIRNEFIPIPSLSGFQLFSFYRVNMVQLMDSMFLPPLEPSEMYTCALFRLDDTQEGTYRLVPTFVWDTMKVKAPKEGMAYLRLINGLSDHPNPNHLNLKLKSVDSAAIFQEAVGFTGIGNYIEVPAGTYPVMVVSPDEHLPLYEQQYIFAEGGYYTAMVVGQKTQGTDKFIITTEN